MQNSQKLTEKQEKVLRNLLTLIETAHALISNGWHVGQNARSVPQVLGWLEQYHKDVKYQLPVPEAPPTPEGEKTPDVANVASEVGK